MRALFVVTTLLLLTALPFAQQSAPSRPTVFDDPDVAAPAAPPAQTPVPAPPPKLSEYNDDAAPQPAPPAIAQQPQTQAKPAAQASATPGLSAREKEARDLAVRFSPVWHQQMTSSDAEHRYDLPTVFDFDGDWTGNNNWAHAADPQYSLWAFTYYSVSESEDHYFVHYACYYPRHWSAAQAKQQSVLDAIQQTYREIVNQGSQADTGPDHENDLAGVLVIVDKWGQSGPEVVAAEIATRDQFLRAVTEGSDLQVPGGVPQQTLRLENGHPAFYIGSQKHDIRTDAGGQSQAGAPMLTLRYGPSTELAQIQNGQATYELVPIKKTFYQHAQQSRQPDLTYGTVADFGDRFCTVAGATRLGCVIGAIGGALRGDYGSANAATAPWMWSDPADRDQPPGSWFFDPAGVLARHFGQEGGEKYLYNPYLGIDLGGPEAAPAK